MVGFADCTDKTNGVNCNETCGHCKDQSTCAVTDGRCPNGCEKWYTSDVCKSYIGMCQTFASNKTTGVLAHIGCN